jgi:hypothetical protein
VVEVKKESSPNKEFDIKKLKAFKEKPYCYKFALFLCLRTGESKSYELEWI